MNKQIYPTLFGAVLRFSFGLHLLPDKLRSKPRSESLLSTGKLMHFLLTLLPHSVTNPVRVLPIHYRVIPPKG